MSYQVTQLKMAKPLLTSSAEEHVLTALANGLSLGVFIMLIFFRHPWRRKNLYRPTVGEGAKLRNRHYRDAVRRAITVVKSSRGALSISVEIDAASRTKVEDTRDLLDNVQVRSGAWSFQSLSHRRSAYAVASQL